MTAVVPHRFLFRYSFPVRRVARMPKKGRRLLNLPENCELSSLSELDGSRSFAQIRVAWNERGLGVSVDVSGKTQPLECRLAEPTQSDGLQVWVDTRNTQSIHRASRFCHHFCLLPTGTGKKADQPTATQLPIARAREEMTLAKPKQIGISVEHRSDGYRLEAWFASEILNGFDPEANPLLGFYYALRDAELGEQFLTVGHEFPFSRDPSLWSTLELS